MMAPLTAILLVVLTQTYTGVNAGDDDEDIRQYGRVKIGGVCNGYSTNGGWSYKGIHGSCNQYLQCSSESQANLLTCAAGTFYDGIACRHSSEVNCQFDPCRSRVPGFRYTDGQSCYGFYECEDGRSKYQSCPSGFFFSSNQQNCFPDETCQKNNLIHPCAYGTTFPFPGRPDLFYLTDGVKTFSPMQCPKGLWYRPNICSCDWIIPGATVGGGCNSMFHFQYNGNFLEANNRVQQVPNTGVSIFRNSAFFSQGGAILIWAMNNIDMDSDFGMCFEFMSKGLSGEIALLSNDYDDADFSYKITFVPGNFMVKAYILLTDGNIAVLPVVGVEPLKPHFVRLAKVGKTIQLRVDNIPAVSLHVFAQVAQSNSPLIIGAANGCVGFVGHFDEFKFYRCLPRGFFGDYDEIDDNDDDDDDDKGRR